MKRTILISLAIGIIVSISIPTGLYEIIFGLTFFKKIYSVLIFPFFFSSVYYCGFLEPDGILPRSICSNDYISVPIILATSLAAYIAVGILIHKLYGYFAKD